MSKKDEINVSEIFSHFLSGNNQYKKDYSSFFNIDEPTPVYQFILIPYLSESFAQYLMNSLNFKSRYKQDFVRDPTTEKWDLINSEGVTIEVKSTIRESEFRRTSVRTSIKSQRKSLIIRVYMEPNGINRAKFVRFRINEEDLDKPIEDCKGKWVNVTEETLKP
jgi:hypothetical protein